jgi:hypothetical protein
MSSVAISGNAGGTGVFTLASPSSSSNYTLTLPAVSGTLVATGTPGMIVQVVQTALTTTTSLNANTTATAVSGMSAVITPTLSTSKILVQMMLNYACQGTTYGGYFTRNSTIIGVGAAGSGQQQCGFGMAYVTDNNQTNSFIYNYLDSPATTSALTYQLYLNNDNSTTVYINRSVTDSAGATGKRSISTITLYEIAA